MTFMHFGTKKALILALILTSSGVLIYSPNVWAARKFTQPVRASDAERAYSANESLLNRFISEREQMLTSAERTTSPHIYRNKLTIINNKITFLEQEMKRTKPRLQQAKVAETKPATKAKAVSKPKVVVATVQPKAQVKTEPRKGYFLAYSSTIAKFLPQIKTDQRNPPEQGVLPVTVSPLASTFHEPRQQPLEGVITQKIEPIAKTELPAREEAIVVTRIEPEAKRYIPVTQDGPGRIDQKILEPTELEKAKPRNIKTGKDWKTMSDGDKEIYVLSIMGNLSRRDVFLMKSYDYYIRSVDRSVTEDPALEAEYVHKILMNNAYASEPESRKDLEKVWS
jgi:hypothetical protein